MSDPAETHPVQKELDTMRDAIAILGDGKLDKNDAKAVVMLLGSLAGFAALAWEALRQFGVL